MSLERDCGAYPQNTSVSGGELVYNRLEMSHLFESFNFLDQDGDARALEGQSLRSVFVWLLVGLFVFGMLAFMMLYQIFNLHHFHWAHPIALAGVGLPSFRAALLIYRSLER